MINFKEDKKSLDNRINIHSKFGQKDMVKWVSDFIKPKNKKKNIKILDLACGDGAQTLKLNNYIKKNKLKCKIIGTDSNKILLKTAKSKNRNKNISYKFQNFDKKNFFKEETFDYVICMFGIYYAKNILNTLKECKRVLTKGGKIIFVGPLRDNKMDFNKIIERAASKKIPKLIGSSRFDSSIYKTIKKKFKKTTLNKFNNVLKIKNKKIFLDYTISSITNKRGVYKKFLINRKIHVITNKLEDILSNEIKIKGHLTITKKVGALIGEK
jgi:ubiquinone/menaquinone biosynthesis C-methylase UbiE